MKNVLALQKLKTHESQLDACWSKHSCQSSASSNQQQQELEQG